MSRWPRMHFVVKSIAASAFALVVGAASSAAQVRPDGGQILRDIERSTPGPAGPSLAPRPAAPSETPLPGDSEKTILVHGFEVRSNRFAPEIFAGLLADLVDRQLTLAQIEVAARRVSQYFRDKDLIATAYVPRQVVKNGIVRIVVVEARVGKILVDPAAEARLAPEIAKRIVASRTKPGEPLRPSQLTEGVAILNDVPGVKATSVMQAGEAEGDTDIVLKVQDKPVLSGTVLADNGGSDSTGRNRAIAVSTLANPFGTGESFSGTALRSRDVVYGRFAATVLAGDEGWSVGPYVSALSYKVGSRFRGLNLSGTAVTLGASANYPLLRSDEYSLTFVATMEHKRFLDFAFDQSTNRKTIDTLAAGISGTLSDDLMGGGTNSFGATATFGRLQIGDEVAAASDRTAGQTGGRYAKLTINAGREQSLVPDLKLYVGGQAQLSRFNLDSSEKLSAGGQDDLRGYPSGETSGDSGLKSMVELRWQAFEPLKLTAFWDNALIRQHVKPWANWEPVPGQANRVRLNSVGASAAWTPLDALTLRGIAAWAVGSNPVRDASDNNSDGKRDRAQLWLQLSVNF